MAQVNITLMGNQYPSVPSVLLPKTGGGTASFVEVSDTTAVATDVAQGKYFYNSQGVKTEGTSSGSAVIGINDTLDEHGGTIREITAVSLQGDTVAPDNLLYGYTAHDAGGNAITGEYVPSGVNTQSNKNATPTESSQVIQPDDGYDNLAQVTVGAISSTYVGSGVPQRTSASLTASGATVSVPSGYYADNVSKSISNGSASTPATTITSTPTISISSGGLITATNSKTQSVTPTVSAGYVSSGTAGTITVNGSNTQQMTVLATTTYNTSTTDQTITSGKYITGTQTIKAVTYSGLSAGNIASGVVVKIGDANDDDRIASVTGTLSFVTYYTGTSDPSSSQGSDGDIYLKVVT